MHPVDIIDCLYFRLTLFLMFHKWGDFSLPLLFIKINAIAKVESEPPLNNKEMVLAIESMSSGKSAEIFQDVLYWCSITSELFGYSPCFSRIHCIIYIFFNRQGHSGLWIL